MRKTILILAGSHLAKERFVNTLKMCSWVWNINIKKSKPMLEILRHLGCAEESEHYEHVLSSIQGIGNRFSNFESNFLREKIEAFQCDDDQIKIDESTGNTFEHFTLLLHHVTSEYVEWLKNEFGAIFIMLGETDENFVSGNSTIDFFVNAQSDNLMEKIKDILGR